jgi:hypothetical protein
MLLAGRDLPVSEVQFSFIASRDPHRLLPRTEEVKYESSIEFQYELPQATFFHTLYEYAFDHINQLQISSDTAIPEMGQQHCYIIILHPGVRNGSSGTMRASHEQVCGRNTYSDNVYIALDDPNRYPIFQLPTSESRLCHKLRFSSRYNAHSSVLV